MSYRYSEYNLGCGFYIIILILYVIFMFLCECGQNATTESEWNNGICTECGVRYELRAAGRYGLKYYACPECGQEVERY